MSLCNSRSRDAAAFGLILLASALLYARSWNNYFLSDSFHVISAITHKGKELDWNYVFATFYRGYEYASSYYRPLTIVTYAGAYALGVINPYAIHIVAYMFHLLASAAVFVLGSRILPRSVALLAALLFAVHPLHSEVLLFEPALADSSVTAALLWAVELHLRCGDSGRLRHFLLAALFYVLALASKEPAVIFPGLAVLADGLVGQSRRLLSARYWLRLSPFIAAVPLYFFVRKLVLGSSMGIFAGMSISLQTALFDLRRILCFTLLPLANHQDRSIQLTAAVLLCSLGVLAYRWIGQRQRLCLSFSPGLCCLGALLLSLVPVFPFWHGIAPGGVTATETRFLYLATAFAVLLAGWAATVVLRDRRLVVASLAVMVAYFALITHRDASKFEVASAFSWRLGEETERLVASAPGKQVCLLFTPGPVRFEGATAFFGVGHIGFSLEPPFHQLSLVSASQDRLCVRQHDGDPASPSAEYFVSVEDDWSFEDTRLRDEAFARWQRCSLESGPAR